MTSAPLRTTQIQATTKTTTTVPKFELEIISISRGNFSIPKANFTAPTPKSSTVRRPTEVPEGRSSSNTTAASKLTSKVSTTTPTTSKTVKITRISTARMTSKTTSKSTSKATSTTATTSSTQKPTTTMNRSEKISAGDTGKKIRFLGHSSDEIDKFFEEEEWFPGGVTGAPGVIPLR